jgi:NitT/TauT family transport system substrate-binding protein
MAAALAAMGVALVAAACAPHPPVVEVPVSQWPGYEFFVLARHEGLDRDAGIRIRPVEYPDPQDIVHAYLRGDVRMAPLTTVEVVDICARAPERCPAVILVLDESTGADVVLARPPTSSVADLRGRRVAVAFSTLGPYVLARALERSGVPLAEVTLRGMTLGAMGSALARGDVDAAVFYPPFSTRAERQRKLRRLFDSRAIPGEIFDVLAVEPAWLREHPAEASALVRAWGLAHTHAAAHPNISDAVMAKREQLPLAEFRTTMAGLRFFRLEQQASLLAVGGPIARNLAEVQRVQRQLGVLPAGGALPAVNDGPVRQALVR